jgi:hypothetical protein
MSRLRTPVIPPLTLLPSGSVSAIETNSQLPTIWPLGVFLLSEHVTWWKRNCGRDERRGRRHRTSMRDLLLCLRKGRHSHSGNVARKRIAGVSAPAKKYVGRDACRQHARCPTSSDVFPEASAVSLEQNHVILPGNKHRIVRSLPRRGHTTVRPNLLGSVITASSGTSTHSFQYGLDNDRCSTSSRDLRPHLRQQTSNTGPFRRESI